MVLDTAGGEVWLFWCLLTISLCSRGLQPLGKPHGVAPPGTCRRACWPGLPGCEAASALGTASSCLGRSFLGPWKRPWEMLQDLIGLSSALALLHTRTMDASVGTFPGSTEYFSQVALTWLVVCWNHACSWEWAGCWTYRNFVSWLLNTVTTKN